MTDRAGGDSFRANNATINSSYRRGRPDSKDIDVIISARDLKHPLRIAPLVDRLKNDGFVTVTLSLSHDDKGQVRATSHVFSTDQLTPPRKPPHRRWGTRGRSGEGARSSASPPNEEHMVRPFALSLSLSPSYQRRNLDGARN